MDTLISIETNVDSSMSNQTLNISPLSDFLCLNEGNLKRVYRFAVKLNTFIDESVYSMS